jgi:hypothetical protein
MIFVSNIHAQCLEFAYKILDLLFGWISALVAKVFVGRSTHDFVNGSSQTVGNADFGFVG